MTAEAVTVNGKTLPEGLYFDGQWQPETYLPGDVPRHGAVAFPVTPVPLAQWLSTGEQPSIPAIPGAPPTLAQEETLHMEPGNDPNLQFLGDLSRWTGFWYRYQMYSQRIQPYLQHGEFVVPPKSVFVMGDNRGGSFDSRYWGVVPLQNVKGRAVCTFWPLNRLKLL